MQYIKLNENNEPENYFINRFRADNPNTSFPTDIPNEMYAAYGVHKVSQSIIPEYNRLTQYAVESVEEIDGTWTQVWTVADLPLEKAFHNLTEAIASDRYKKETSGISWTDADGVVWVIATDLDSQQRLNSTVSAINNNIRTTSGYWKCLKVVSGEELVSYRMTTNDEILAWSRLVHEHVQKCFDAETNAIAKVEASDLSASFETEYDLLTG